MPQRVSPDPGATAQAGQLAADRARRRDGVLSDGAEAIEMSLSDVTGETREMFETLIAWAKDLTGLPNVRLFTFVGKELTTLLPRLTPRGLRVGHDLERPPTAVYFGLAFSVGAARPKFHRTCGVGHRSLQNWLRQHHPRPLSPCFGGTKGGLRRGLWLRWVDLNASHHQVVQELRGRLYSGHEQVISGPGAGHVEQVALGVVDLFRLRILGGGFDAGL